MNKKIQAFFVLAVAISIPLLFQNCGGVGDAASSSVTQGSVTNQPPDSKVCPTPTSPVYTNLDTENYVVDGESVLTRARGRYKFPTSVPIGSAFAFQFSFTSGLTGLTGAVVTVSGPYSWETSISECPGQFEVASGCRARSVEVATVDYAVSPTVASRGTCQLDASKPYYINVRLVQSCEGLSSCDFYFNRPSFATPTWGP